MRIEKKSFLSNIIDGLSCKGIYNEFKEMAQIIVPIVTILLTLLYGAAHIWHTIFIRNILYNFTGLSLLMIIYIAAMILVLDVTVDVEIYEWEDFMPKKEQKPWTYKLTIVWGLFLMILGSISLNISQKYKIHYVFECTTLLVDKRARVYHLDCSECELEMGDAEGWYMKGYEIDDSYTPCERCKEWLKDLEYSQY